MNINISLILSTGALAMTDAFRQDSHKLLRAPNVPIATTGGSPSSLVPLLPLVSSIILCVDDYLASVCCIANSGALLTPTSFPSLFLHHDHNIIMI